MLYVETKYWDRFIQKISEAFVKLGKPEVVWFRGHSNATHKLLPSLLRYQNGLIKEQQLFEYYDQWARGSALGGKEAISEWDILFEMQHYGVPTRLLDWTDVFGIAVFFASLRKEGDGCIYLLDPVKMNKAHGREGLITHWDETQITYRDMYWNGRPVKPTHPFAISPRHHSNRLTAQRGRFTIHGSILSSIDELAPDFVQRVVLEEKDRDGAKYFLRLAGINEFAMFPDVYGASTFIKNLVGLL